MDVHIAFQQPFDGFIFAEDFYDKSGCRWYGNMRKHMNITIPITSESVSETCGASVDKVKDQQQIMKHNPNKNEKLS